VTRAKIAAAAVAVALPTIALFEGLVLRPYRDPVGILTVCYGETAAPMREYTPAQCMAMLQESAAKHAKAIEPCMPAGLPVHVQAASISFAYNVGAGAMAGSSVLKAHNRGDTVAAARAFGLWNKARVGGVLKPLPGLTARRAAEAALYAEPVLRSVADEMEPLPQAVEPERPMSASKINRASLLAGSTATLAAAQETLQVIGGVKNGVESVGSWLVPGLLVAVVALCAYITWQRFEQRSDGAA
jgi:lysozyme